MIKKTEDVYRFVERLKAESEKQGVTALAIQLDDALHLGSSGLEILGAIRETLINNSMEVDRLLGSAGKEDASQVIVFIDRAFGR